MIPAYKGMKVLIKVSGQVDMTGLDRRKPALLTEYWLLENGMQPPVTTTCPNPACAGFWGVTSLDWREDDHGRRIPGWSFGMKNDRRAIKAELNDAIREWTRTLLMIYGLGSFAISSRPELRMRPNWTKPSAREMLRTD